VLLLVVGGELHVQLLVRGGLPLLFGARLSLLLLLEQHADIGLLLVALMMPLSLLVVAVQMWLLVGGKLVVLELVGTGSQLVVVVVLVLLHGGYYC
jgi:hypothetical protein